MPGKNTNESPMPPADQRGLDRKGRVPSCHSIPEAGRRVRRRQIGGNRGPAAFTMLLKLPEFVKTDSELSEDFVKKRRPDFASAVDRDRNRPPIRMNPALMASSLPAPFKTKLCSGAAELLSAGARHSQSRCCPPAAIALSRRIQRQSSQTRVRVRPELLPASA
jgi:hypothetical protein